MSISHLGKDQKKALKKLKKFVKSNKINITLDGQAGTGKTTLIGELYLWLKKKKISVLGVAPSHKAKNILSDNLNSKNKPGERAAVCCTLAYLLGKIPKTGFIGILNFE